MFSLVNAQTITFNGCHPLFDNQNYIFSQTGTDGTGRKMYTTTPVDGQVCGGLGTCEFKIQWSVTNSRWEFIADEGNGTFSAPYLIYSNTSASTPNPPSLLLGAWNENGAVTSNSCGGVLNGGNSVLSGEVQDNVLSTDQFSVNKGIAIYPNPTNNVLNVKSESVINSVSIWNVQGQKIIEANHSNAIDVSTLNAGMYLAKIQTENGMKVSTFIKK